MKVGVIGLGKMGILHSSILNTLKDVQIVAVAEKEKILTKYLKKAIPNINVYKDYKKMFDKEDFDLVYITTPVASHLPIAQACVDKEINFFVEKPLTKNLEEAKIICSKLKKSNVIHSVGYNVRFVETFSHVKSLLNQNILGEISSINSSIYVSNIFSKPSGWRFKKNLSGGGVILELGCHLIDLLLWYFGPITEVSGKTKSVYSEVEDFANAKFEFSNKIHGEMDTSWSKEGYSIPEMNIEILGKNGKLRVNQDFIEINLKNPEPPFKQPKTKIYKQEIEHGVPFDVAGLDYTKEDIHVIDSVRKKSKTLIDAFEASLTQSVIQAIYDSAEQNSKKTVEYID